MNKNNKKAVIVMSGGQDSTTCLIWAKKKFTKIYGITFDYGQRHAIELEKAQIIAKKEKIPLKTHKIRLFKELTVNSLIDKKLAIKEAGKNSPPNTFVDGRNLIFLSIAAIYAKQLKIKDIITGVCQTDFSGYPDCRREFIDSLEKTLALAMDFKFKIHTPLMYLTKKETVLMMKKYKKLNLLKHTHTCYTGKEPACGKCPACRLRLKGFNEAGIKDPLKYA